MRSARDGLEALRLALRRQGGTVAEVLVEPTADGSLAVPGPAQLAAAGPRTSDGAREYELLIEMILEGSRLHYGEPMVVVPPEPDLALLLGDQLYALGLSRLAALGDLAAVAELGDVISLVAQAHTAEDPALAEAVWEAGAVAIGWGQTAAHREAKELARRHDPGAAKALLEGARAARGGVVS